MSLPLSPAEQIIVTPLFTRLPEKAIQQLQLIQNAAAHILTKGAKSVSISQFSNNSPSYLLLTRLTLKALLLVYKAMNGLAPDFICDMLPVYQTARSTSQESCFFQIPKSPIKIQGQGFLFLGTLRILPAEMKFACCQPSSMLKTPQAEDIHS